MPGPALSAAARLTSLTNPVGTGRPASITAPTAPRSAAPSAPKGASPQSAFPNMLADQLGLSSQVPGTTGAVTSGQSDPLSALMGPSGAAPFASPQIAQALANAQKAVTSTASAAGAALTSKGQKAVAWAKSMLGRQDWNNLCERFVEEAYGTRGVYPSAKDAAKQLVTHKGSASLRTAPVGALLYFAADETNDGFGHAAIYLGKGEMISARPDGVTIESVDTPYNNARYIGWGPAPSKFPGRKAAPAPTSSISPPASQPVAAAVGAATPTPASRSGQTSVWSPSTPRPSLAPPIPPRLPR